MSAAAKRPDTAPAPRAKTQEQTLLLSKPVKRSAVLGWSLDFSRLNQALPGTSLSPKQACLINPVFCHLCCWWILWLLRGQGMQESSPLCPNPHTGTTAPAHSGSCSRPRAGMANSSRYPAFSQSCFSQLFLTSSLGTTKASLIGTSVCDSAMGSVGHSPARPAAPLR